MVGGAVIPRISGWRWRLWQRLALSYMVITVATFLTIETVVQIVDWALLRRSLAATQTATWTERAAADLASTAFPRLSHDEMLWWVGRLHQRFAEARTRSYGTLVIEFEPTPASVFSLLLLDANGQVRASDPVDAAPVGTPGREVLAPDERALLDRALGPRPAVTEIVEREGGHATVLAPIRTTDTTRGVLVVRTTLPALGSMLWRQQTLTGFAALVGGALVFFGAIGLGFGAFTAVRLARRLTRIGAAAEAWSRGEFSVRADDSSGDEIGQLARRLNDMSTQLQGVLRVRQDLAAVEERHRLARDLHDAVKQQIFALGLQLAAAKATWDTQPREARIRIEEAERLVSAVQQELVDLIRQLRPASNDTENFTESIRQLADNWSRQHDVTVTLESSLMQPLPAALTDGLFRIVQEALANVARHSGATSVQIRMWATGRTLGADIEDDGRGFLPDRVVEGMGLRNMRERAGALPDGQLQVRPGARGGTTVTVRCRLDGYDEHSHATA